MGHEEEYHRSQREQNRYQDNRRRPHSHERREEFNDFRSRWGNSVPPLQSQHDRFYNEQRYLGQHRRDNWRPHEQHNQYRRQEHEPYEHYEQRQQPNWRLRDVDFNPENQHANDRWSQDEYMPHPRHQEHRHRGEYGRFSQEWGEKDRHRGRSHNNHENYNR